MTPHQQLPLPRTRLAFIDAARVFAMLLMVQAHVCDTLLAAPEKATAFYGLYWNLRGFTGPLFYTLGGFALVVASDSRWNEYGRPGPRLYARIRRALLLMLLGYGLQMPRWHGALFFDFSADDWKYLLRGGVLHCVAWSMLLCHLLIAVTRSRRAFTVAVLGSAVAIVALTPRIAALELNGPVAFTMLLNAKQGSLFPLFPYVAYFFVGAGLARLHLDTRWLSTPLRFGVPVAAFGGLMLHGALWWRGLEPGRLSAAHFWITDPTVFLNRIGAAWLAFGAMALLLFRVRRSPRWLEDLGGRALSVYVLHLVLLYGVPKIPGLVQRIGPKLSLWQAFLVGPLLLLASAACSMGWDRLTGLVSTALARCWTVVRARLFPAVSPGADVG